MDDGAEGLAPDEGGISGDGILVEDALDAHPALQPLVHLVERGGRLFNGNLRNLTSLHQAVSCFVIFHVRVCFRMVMLS